MREIIFILILALSWHLPAQITFQRQVFNDDIHGDIAMYSVCVADIDGDGDADMVYGSGRVVWYENTDGNGSFGQPHVISEEEGHVRVADIDGDGDMDIIVRQEVPLFSLHYALFWYENLDGLGNFGYPIFINVNEEQDNYVYDKRLEVKDLDWDGDVDIISGDNWLENTDGAGNFLLINSSPILDADMDGDGDFDNIYVSTTQIKWREYDSSGNYTGNEHPVCSNWPPILYHKVVDMDNDGDLDMVVSCSTKIAWFENMDGLGNFGQEIIISDNRLWYSTWSDYYGNEGMNDLYISDMDGDGDMDLVTRSSGLLYAISWYEIEAGMSLATEHIISKVPMKVNAIDFSDIDGDGDIDLAGGDRDLFWFENTDGQGTFSRLKFINNSMHQSINNQLYDMDNDGDLDIFLSNYYKTVWYENIDGQGTFANQHLISTLPILPNIDNVQLMDVDDDGDLDMLRFTADAVTWYENIDGLGNFVMPQELILNNYDNAINIKDMDGDGDMDIVTYPLNQNGTDKIGWYENLNGQTGFGPKQIIEPDITYSYIKSGVVADFDNDGDYDLVFSDDSYTYWYENLDGQGNFSSKQMLNTPLHRRIIQVVDIDGDGDSDFLTKNSWIENVDGQTDFSVEHPTDNSYKLAMAVDIDDDGDMDIISNAGNFNLGMLINIDGSGNFNSEHLFYVEPLGDTFSNPFSISIGDIDGDGDVDILASFNKVYWFGKIYDDMAPVPDVAVLPDVYAECQVDMLTPPTATDNVAGTVTATTDMPFPITAQGTTVVTWTYDDGNGNISSQTQNVIIQDTTDPVAIGQNIQVDLNGATQVSITPADVDNGSYDNCAIENMSLSQEYFDAVGIYNVDFTVYDVAGNSDTVTVEVEVINSLAISLQIIDDVKIYPNPVKQNLNIVLENNPIEHLSITDMSGKLLLNKTMNKPVCNLNLTGLQKGMYILTLKTRKYTLVHKFIKN